MDEEEEFTEVYNDSGREELVKNDEMDPEEEAFMKGYDEGSDEETDESEDDDYEKAFDGSEEE